MYQFFLIIHVLAAVCIIALVMVQQGKGAAVGSSFGSGASQTIFGSRGSGSFLLKVTIGFVILFFGTSLMLNRIATTAIKQPVEIKLSPLPPVQSQLPKLPPVEAPTNDISNIPGVPPPPISSQPGSDVSHPAGPK